MNWLRKPLEFLLYSNVFIGLCAVALTLVNQLTVNGEMHFDKTCWFIFFSTVFTYSYLKVTSSANAVYATGHRSWAAEHQQLAKNITVIGLLGTACFFFLLPKEAMITVFALGVFTAFYGFIYIPFTKPKIKLRDLGSVKTLFVGIVWSVTTVIVPLAGENVEVNMMVFLLLRRFLFVMALTLVFEIKDLKGDQDNGLKTIPVFIGVGNTKLLAQLMMVALIIINCIQYFFYDVSLANMLAVDVSLLISIGCIQPVTEETPEYWYYLVLDGMMVLQFILVYAATRYF